MKKPSKPPTFKRNSSSFSSPYSDLPRRKPLQRSASKPEREVEDEEDFFGDRLDDVGLVQALATDLNLRDVAQAIMYIRRKMWSSIPEERAGMNSTRIAEVLNFRDSLPPIVTVTHIQALLNSPTAVEREIAELVRKGAIRKINVGGRGSMGETLILVKDLDEMIQKSEHLEQAVKDMFIAHLHEYPTALKISRVQFSQDDAKALIHAGFLTTSTSSWTTTDIFSKPGDGSRGTMTSIQSISRAASGSLAAVGGQGAVHAAGGSGGGAKPLSGTGDFSVAIPVAGNFLKLLSGSQTHLVSLLSKSKYREMPESLLKQRWDGGIAADDAGSQARRNRGEFAGILPGRTRKWKQFYGVAFEWILEECVGAGLLEVFDTGSVGRGVRAL